MLFRSLRSALGFPAQPVEEDDSEPYDLEVPACVSTRGSRLKIVIGKDGGHTRYEPDASLIKGIVRAHDWLDRLRTGKAKSIRDIAVAESLTGSYVTRLMRLAFLAPDIVEAILDGGQPVELTTKQLLRDVDLPLDWREQRRLLGFDPA